MKKKIVSVLMTSVMLASMLAGCGGNSSGSEGGSKETADGEEVYNVVMQLPIVGDTPAGLEDVEAAVNELTEPEIGVTVTLEPVGAFDLGTETSLAISSGEKLDLNVSLYTGIASLVESGSIIELDELLEQNGQDIVEVCDVQMKGGMYDNKQYAVPLAYLRGNRKSFIANKAVLDKYNISIEKDKYYTVEELEDIFATVKEGEGDSFYIMGGAYNMADVPFATLHDVTLDNMSGGIGLLFDADFNTTGEMVNFFESDEYAEYAERMYEWAKKGYYSPDASTTTETAGAQMKAGTALGTFANGSPTLEAEYFKQIGGEAVRIDLNPAYSATSEFQSVLWSIPTTCENPEKTMQFLNMLYTTPELSNLLMYGIEGVSYDIVEEDEHGTVVQVKEDAPYFMEMGVFGNRLSWYIQAPGETTVNEESQAYSDSVERVSPAIGFVPKFEAVSTQYSAVNAVIAQHTPIINTGAIDPAKELPEFINALKGAGIDDVLEEVQSQYEEFKAAQ